MKYHNDVHVSAVINEHVFSKRKGKFNFFDL